MQAVGLGPRTGALGPCPRLDDIERRGSSATKVLIDDQLRDQLDPRVLPERRQDATIVVNLFHGTEVAIDIRGS